MKIAIDAGHGWNTPGKRSPDGMREYEFNRETALFLRNELAADILFVHHDSRDVPLSERVKKANEADADLFVSIHANAFGEGWTSAHGIETYVYTSRPPKAMKIAQSVQKELISATGRRDRGVKTADFYVLRKTKMPAILIEAGFMTNREEAALLQSVNYRKTCARAIAAGIHRIF
ncbi:N-acetylmuramoyl-L-alanine amidase [Domibacillus epiphyticus]|uniref:N-acetylmuramoyl-L-alanine amidase n=1 Tax=Domibacillus epiphyticus TaxID=1714355 RepID=A0A1V2AB98_9BACI|nr:N-acetylmuramoyl-L-alanine amidase [Domibacillus epiphyticus]OMP68273.1 N-acetylmuramoyl-L-alanine amidase [Domibacillus epiphyticus]